MQQQHYLLPSDSETASSHKGDLNDEHDEACLLAGTSTELFPAEEGDAAPRHGRQPSALDKYLEICESAKWGGSHNELAAGVDVVDIRELAMVLEGHTEEHVFHDGVLTIVLNAAVNTAYLKEWLQVTDYTEGFSVGVNRLQNVGESLLPFDSELLSQLVDYYSPIENIDKSQVLFFLPYRLEFQCHYISMKWRGIRPNVCEVCDNLGPIPSLNCKATFERAEAALHSSEPTIDPATCTMLAVHRAVRKMHGSDCKIEETEGYLYPFRNGCCVAVTNDAIDFCKHQQLGSIPRERQLVSHFSIREYYSRNTNGVPSVLCRQAHDSLEQVDQAAQLLRAIMAAQPHAQNVPGMVNVKSILHDADDLQVGVENLTKGSAFLIKNMIRAKSENVLCSPARREFFVSAMDMALQAVAEEMLKFDALEKANNAAPLK